MTPNEISRVQRYLRTTFKNNEIRVVPPTKKGEPVAVSIGDEFIGALYRDDDEGEISYALHISILNEDLPPAGGM